MLNRPYETWDHLLGLLGEMQVVFQEFLSLLREEERLLLGMDLKEQSSQFSAGIKARYCHGIMPP